jgi:hypothetical protein
MHSETIKFDSVSVYCEVGTKLLNTCYIKFVLKATLFHFSGGSSPPFSEKARVRFRASICKTYGEKLAGLSQKNSAVSFRCRCNTTPFSSLT